MRVTQTQACILSFPVLASESSYGTSVFTKHSIIFSDSRVTKHKQKGILAVHRMRSYTLRGESKRRAQGRARQVPQNDQTRPAANVGSLRHQSKNSRAQSRTFLRKAKRLRNHLLSGTLLPKGPAAASCSGTWENF